MIKATLPYAHGTSPVVVGLWRSYCVASPNRKHPLRLTKLLFSNLLSRILARTLPATLKSSTYAPPVVTLGQISFLRIRTRTVFTHSLGTIPLLADWMRSTKKSRNSSLPFIISPQGVYLIYYPPSPTSSFLQFSGPHLILVALAFTPGVLLLHTVNLCDVMLTYDIEDTSEVPFPSLRLNLTGHLWNSTFISYGYTSHALCLTACYGKMLSVPFSFWWKPLCVYSSLLFLNKGSRTEAFSLNHSGCFFVWYLAFLCSNHQGWSHNSPLIFYSGGLVWCQMAPNLWCDFFLEPLSCTLYFLPHLTSHFHEPVKYQHWTSVTSFCCDTFSGTWKDWASSSSLQADDLCSIQLLASLLP